MHCLSASDMAYILRAKDPFQIKACFPASHALRMIRGWELKPDTVRLFSMIFESRRELLFAYCSAVQSSG